MDEDKKMIIRKAARRRVAQRERNIIKKVFAAIFSSVGSEAIEKWKQDSRNSDEHALLGFVFEELVKHDPTLPQNTPVGEALESFVRKTISHDSFGVLGGAPLGSDADRFFFSVRGKSAKLTGIAEIKLKEQGIRSDQLLREEENARAAVKALQKPTTDIVVSQISVSTNLSKEIIVPRGERTKEHFAGWNIRESIFDYLDIIDAAEGILGTKISYWLGREKAYHAHVLWETLDAALGHYSDVADHLQIQKHFPNANKDDIVAGILIGKVPLRLTPRKAIKRKIETAIAQVSQVDEEERQEIHDSPTCELWAQKLSNRLGKPEDVCRSLANILLQLRESIHLRNHDYLIIEPEELI